MPIVAFCVSAISAADALTNRPAAPSDLEQLLVPRQRFAIGLLVRPGGEIGFEAANAFGQRVHDFARRCAERAGVAIGDARGDQEVLARRREHGRVVRLRVRHESRFTG